MILLTCLIWFGILSLRLVGILDSLHYHSMRCTHTLVQCMIIVCVCIVIDCTTCTSNIVDIIYYFYYPSLSSLSLFPPHSLLISFSPSETQYSMKSTPRSIRTWIAHSIIIGSHHLTTRKYHTWDVVTLPSILYQNSKIRKLSYHDNNSLYMCTN